MGNSNGHSDKNWNLGLWLAFVSAETHWGFSPSVVENKGKGIIAKRVNTMMSEYIYYIIFQGAFVWKPNSALQYIYILEL